jgi:hypothetical protein
MAEIEHPYRDGGAPIARYALRTAWLPLVTRGAIGGLFALVAIVLVEVQLGGMFIAAGWIVCLATAVFALVMVAGMKELRVPKGSEVRVYRTHVVLPSMFGTPRAHPIRSLEVEVHSREASRDLMHDGRPVRVPMSTPIDIAIISGAGRCKFSARLFETPTHAARLASDLRSLRDGKDPVDHDRPDVSEIFADVQRSFPEHFGKHARAPKRDEEDERLDDELRKIE